MGETTIHVAGKPTQGWLGWQLNGTGRSMGQRVESSVRMPWLKTSRRNSSTRRSSGSMLTSGEVVELDLGTWTESGVDLRRQAWAFPNKVALGSVLVSHVDA